MKQLVTQHMTMLEAETLLDMLKLNKLETVLVAYHHSPLTKVKDWSERPDRQQWGTWKLTYTTEALKDVYDQIGIYVYESERQLTEEKK